MILFLYATTAALLLTFFEKMTRSRSNQMNLVYLGYWQSIGKDVGNIIIMNNLSNCQTYSPTSVSKGKY